MEIVLLLVLAVVLFLLITGRKVAKPDRKTSFRPRPAAHQPRLNGTSGTEKLRAKKLQENQTRLDNRQLLQKGELKGRAYVIDGDTLVIRKVRIRLAGVDAPELHQPYGMKSKWAMVDICRGQNLTVELTGEVSYGRLVGIVRLPGGEDVGAELIRRGLAIDLTRFSGGRYRHLETTALHRYLRYRGNCRQ